MLRCWNIKEVKLQNAHFFGGKLFWKQVKKQQSTHCHRENISNFRSSEHWEIKCLFGLSKGTVPSHWQSYPYSWGFFRGKKKGTNLNIEMKITNAWDFLILPPTTPTLLLSFILSSYLIPISSMLVFHFPLMFSFLSQSHSFCQTPPSFSRSNCPSHSGSTVGTCRWRLVVLATYVQNIHHSQNLVSLCLDMSNF